MDRIYRIHQLLQNGEYPNCTKLAKEFEVVVRTVKRDIDFMKCRMDLPVAFDTRRNGYFYERPVEQFPAVPLSEAELFALLVAQKAVEQYRGTPFLQPLQMAFRRLTGQLDETVKFGLGGLEDGLSFHPLAPWEMDLRAFAVVTKALAESRELVFEYRNRGTPRYARRRVQPYHLGCIQEQWYLIAFDVNRQGLRTFALARLRKPSLTRTEYQVPKSFNPNDYLSGSLSVYKGEGDYEVLLEFDRWAADEVRGRHWHSSQQMTELTGGRLRLRLKLNDLGEVERWVLSFGVHATVLGPKELVERVKQTSIELLKRYQHGMLRSALA